MFRIQSTSGYSSIQNPVRSLSQHHGYKFQIYKFQVTSFNVTKLQLQPKLKREAFLWHLLVGHAAGLGPTRDRKKNRGAGEGSRTFRGQRLGPEIREDATHFLKETLAFGSHKLAKIRHEALEVINISLRSWARKQVWLSLRNRVRQHPLQALHLLCNLTALLLDGTLVSCGISGSFQLRHQRLSNRGALQQHPKA